MGRFQRAELLVVLVATMATLSAGSARADGPPEPWPEQPEGAPALPEAAPELSPALAEARAAMELAEFPGAIAELERALERGGLQPVDLRECHRLRGEALVALGRPEEARDAFTSLLVLDPAAELGSLVSPKIVDELESARQALAGQRLAAEALVGERADQVVLQIVSDPLSMAVEVELAYAGPRGRQARVRSQLIEGKAIFDVPTGASGTLQIALLDGYGNVLDTYAIEYVPEAIVAPAVPVAARAGTPLWSRWWVWAAGSAGAAVVGGAFGVASKNAENRLDTVLATPGDHFYSEAVALEDSARSRARWANVGFAAAGGLAIASAYFFWRGGESEPGTTTIAPSTDGTGATLQIGGHF